MRLLFGRLGLYPPVAVWHIAHLVLLLSGNMLPAVDSSFSVIVFVIHCLPAGSPPVYRSFILRGFRARTLPHFSSGDALR